MASLVLVSTSFLPSFQTPSPTPAKPLKALRARSVTCKATSDHEGNQQNSSANNGKLDRREVLLGLGGLYGMSGALNSVNGPFASAAPIQAPDLSKCHLPEIDMPTDMKLPDCCPPLGTVIDYTPPADIPSRLRVRLPAHSLHDEHIAKYNKAMQLMRDLPDDDPRSFKQQAKVHCAYCNGAYDQIGMPDLNIQVHFSWLFLPFHRWQLYFYERILGHLIDDPTFALPFWNWDHPDGMSIPCIFADPTSSLYDEKRDTRHQPRVVVDLVYTNDDKKKPDQLPNREQIDQNLYTIYNQVCKSKNARCFHGKPYRAFDRPNPGMGSLENMHNSLHIWGGSEYTPNGEDLGHFYSSGNDPLFYSLHCNVDRLWSVWKTLPGRKRRDFTDPDWLEASFLFYDEKTNLVRVKVKDAVDTRKLGYVYKERPIPWVCSRPKPRKFRVATTSSNFLVPAAPPAAKAIMPLTAFPLTLDKTISTVVPRPIKGRSSNEKEEAEEVLFIHDIEFDSSLAVGFKVYVNDEDEPELIGPKNSEFAGCFTSVPSRTKANQGKTKTSLCLPITELLEDLDAENDDVVVVTLKPTSAEGNIQIGGIEIELEF